MQTVQEDFSAFRERVLEEWKKNDPILADREGYRQFFNEQYDKKIRDEEKRLQKLEKMSWLKRLQALAPRHRGERLADKLYKEVLIKGEKFRKSIMDEFKDSIALFSELLVIHSKYTEEKGRFSDMFVEYMAAENLFNARAGQFPTPPTVATFMAKMTLGLEDDLKGPPKMISDPAAGTGTFMLHTAKHYVDTIGKLNFIFFNTDLDFRMYVFCTFNAILNGIPAVNIWGNSLSLEFFEGTVTIPINGVAMWKHIDKDRCKEVMTGGYP